MIKIDLGIVSMEMINENIWTNLSNEQRILDVVNEINADIGKEISMVFDTLYGQGAGGAYYDIKEGEHSVVIRKPMTEQAQQWWFQPRRGESMDIFYLISSDSDLRIQAGDRLVGRYSSGAIPISELGKEMWWLSQNRGATPITNTEGLGKNELQKIVDSIVVNSYRSLIPRVALGE